MGTCVEPRTSNMVSTVFCRFWKLALSENRGETPTIRCLIIISHTKSVLNPPYFRTHPIGSTSLKRDRQPHHWVTLGGSVQYPGSRQSSGNTSDMFFSEVVALIARFHGSTEWW